MIKRPPQEKQWQSWLYVVLWTLVIFVTIPLARAIQQYVYQEWNRDIFTYAVLLTVGVSLVAAIIYVRRNRLSSRSSYLWLIAVSGILIFYTIDLGKQSPEEAVHFVQYGVLGMLVYRALIHHLQDASIYFAAAIVCGILGTVDEFIQWLTPRRVWGLKDIWLNFFASVSVLTGIARGLQPRYIAGKFSPANLRILCHLTITALSILGASLLFTPPRVAWVAEQISWLGFLKYHDSVVLEYGYLYEDPEIGVFRSRFAPGKLKQMDRERAVEAADILDRYQDEQTYPAFLSLYSPITDPFVHEARVHLFRRDRYYNTAMNYENQPDEYARRLTIAWRENMIMEKHFSNTLQLSNYVWSDEKKARVQAHHRPNEVYDSWVSRGLITQVREWQVVSFFIVLILVVFVIYWHRAKIPAGKPSP